MATLDRHVAAVRRRLTLDATLARLARSVLIAAGVCLLAILIHRLFWLTLPQPWYWLAALAGAALLAGCVMGYLARPTDHHAALELDRRLGLKEKFSSALKLRGQPDPFAQAAVRDAEYTAASVSLGRHFPLTYPTQATWAAAACILALVVGWLMPQVDLFGRRQQHQAQQIEVKRQEEARQSVERALAALATAPPQVRDDAGILQARRDLEALLQRPALDPADAARSAHKALQDANDALKNRIEQTARYAEARNNARAFASIKPPANEKGPVADAHRAIAEGRFDDAFNHIAEAVKAVEDAPPQEQQKAAEQMQNLADQLQKMAQNPAAQQQMQQQLQQLGANQQQAQQMAQQLQQAAQGNPQAQQQLQQQVQQLMQQMNNGQGATQQQQQQVQQIMQQLQQQANAQQQAQGMQQAAQQLAQAMQQAAQGGQTPAQQQQQLAQGAQQLQQQLQQLQAIQKDAQQMAAAQQAMQQAMNQPGNNPGGNNAGDQPWNPDVAEVPQEGPGGAGIGMGERPRSDGAPFTIKQEVSPSIDDEKGKTLASYFVKADAIKGEARAELREVAEAGEKQATDEIDQDRIPRSTQNSVRDYFRSLAPEKP